MQIVVVLQISFSAQEQLRRDEQQHGDEQHGDEQHGDEFPQNPSRDSKYGLVANNIVQTLHWYTFPDFSEFVVRA